MSERPRSASDRGRPPDPPWWAAGRRQASRTALSRESIVDAAVRVLDEHGLDGLSMRRVAEELDTGPASLYWHVANKEQLLDVILDRVIGEIPLPEPDPERWQQQLRDLAYDGRGAFRRYRDVARASLGRVPMGPNLLRMVEWQLELLRRAGIPPGPAAWFGDLFALYIGAHAFEETVAADRGPDDAATAMNEYIRSLPPEEFPYLLASMGELMAGDADERFAFGLELMLRGLATFAEDQRIAGPPRSPRGR